MVTKKDGSQEVERVMVIPLESIEQQENSRVIYKHVLESLPELNVKRTPTLKFASRT